MPFAKKSSAIWLFLLAAVIVSGVSLSYVVSGLFWQHVFFPDIDHEPTRFPDVTPAQQAAAGQIMNVSFPPNTRFLLLHYADAQDDVMHLKIDMPADELREFLKSKTLENAEFQRELRHVGDVAGWADFTPSKSKRFRSAQVSLPKAESLNICVDEDDPDRVVVYLIWHQT